MELRIDDDRQKRVVVGLVALALLLVVIGIFWPDEKKPDAAKRPAEVIAPVGGADALIVPSIGLDAPIIPIELNRKGVLSPPDDTDIVGWWQRSAEPGASKGQTVVTGHTVHSGGGVMNRLGKVKPGAVVQIRDGGRMVDYRVTKVFVYSKAQLAKNAQALFGQSRPGGRLVLITCTDWVRGDYLSNIIVFAKPVRAEADAGADADAEADAGDAARAA